MMILVMEQFALITLLVLLEGVTQGNITSSLVALLSTAILKKICFKHILLFTKIAICVYKFYFDLVPQINICPLPYFVPLYMYG